MPKKKDQWVLSLILDLEDDPPITLPPIGFIYAAPWWRWCRAWAELPPQR